MVKNTAFVQIENHNCLIGEKTYSSSADIVIKKHFFLSRFAVCTILSSFCFAPVLPERNELYFVSSSSGQLNRIGFLIPLLSSCLVFCSSFSV